MQNDETYLTAEQLSKKIHYSTRYIRERMLKTVFVEGRHYIHPFGGRRILFIWENIEEDMLSCSSKAQKPQVSMSTIMPLARGGVCHG